MKGPELPPDVQAQFAAASEAADRGDVKAELTHFLCGQLLVAKLQRPQSTAGWRSGWPRD